MILHGKLIEVGNLQDPGSCSSRGLRLQKDGEIIEVTGLTKDECRSLAKMLGENLAIHISNKE